MTQILPNILQMLAPAAPAAPAPAAGGGFLTSRTQSILEGGATALSILYGFAGAAQEAAAMEGQARDALVEGEIEELQGLERRVGLREALIRAVGERDLAFAASGADTGFGTPAQIRKEVNDAADRAQTISDMTTVARRERLNERARYLRIQAKSVRRGAFVGALAQAADAATSIAYRG